jgi:hypothetical protein
MNIADLCLFNLQQASLLKHYAIKMWLLKPINLSFRT